ncbi:hypothetical protein ACFL34_02445 [Candidatus Sumerlaeota bacterium]
MASGGNSALTSIGAPTQIKRKQRKSYDEIISELSADLARLMREWLAAKDMLLKSFLGKEITDDDERTFLDLKTSLSRLSRQVSARTPEYLDVGATEIAKIIKAGVNLKVLGQLPTITKKDLYGKWHTAFMQMNRTKGALGFFSEGYRPSRKRQRENPIVKLANDMSGMFGHRRTGIDGKGESPVKTLIIVVGGVAVAAALIWLALSIET